MWHGEAEEHADHHPWLRAGASLGRGVFTAAVVGGQFSELLIPVGRALGSSAGWALGAAGTVVAEASPLVIAGAAAGTVAVVGAAAVVVASQHNEAHARHLQNIIRTREPRNPVQPWHKSAEQLWDTLQWHLSPQKEGLPHVYHGSVWRSKARAEHLAQVQALCAPLPDDGIQSPSDKLWSDLLFCYSLWLEYNPHAANWGTCASYGSGAIGFCWHNRWREDMRHALSDLVRSCETVVLDTDKERACALCFLAMLDHVLSWNVVTPEHGSSDLVPTDWHSYRGFCLNLQQRFAEAWAVARAPLDADLDLEGFDSHIVTMVERDTPEGFCNLW